jgi:hypothetical protein
MAQSDHFFFFLHTRVSVMRRYYVFLLLTLILYYISYRELNRFLFWFYFYCGFVLIFSLKISSVLVMHLRHDVFIFVSNLS